MREAGRWMGWIVVALVAASVSAVDLKADLLQERLNAIDGGRQGPQTDAAKLERQCRELLNQASDDRAKGRIYAEMALIYSQDGLREPEKAAALCEEALGYPLDPATRGRLHIYWADALLAHSGPATRDRFAATRPEIASVCLRGLKEILPRGLAPEEQPIPDVMKVHLEGANPAAIAEAQEQVRLRLEERDRIMLENQLIYFRDVLIQKCVKLYSQGPPATDELRGLATRIVGEAFANDLVGRIKR